MTPPDTEYTSLSPSDIASQRFDLARRGYDCEEVEAFLREVADHVDRLCAEVEWQRARGKDLRRRTKVARRDAISPIGRDFTVDRCEVALPAPRELPDLLERRPQHQYLSR